MILKRLQKLGEFLSLLLQLIIYNYSQKWKAIYPKTLDDSWIKNKNKKKRLIVLVCVKRHLVVRFLSKGMLFTFFSFFLSQDQEWRCWFMGVRNHGYCHGNRSLQYYVFLHCSAGTGKRASMVSVTRGPCGILISSLSFKHNHTQNVWMYRCPLLQHSWHNTVSRSLSHRQLYPQIDLCSAQDASCIWSVH